MVLPLHASRPSGVGGLRNCDMADAHVVCLDYVWSLHMPRMIYSASEKLSQYHPTCIHENSGEISGIMLVDSG